jgi:hypothetical protein
MDKRGKMGKGAIFIIVLIIILLVWGYIGGMQLKSGGATCDIGIGNLFCWKWHTVISP